MGGKGKSWCYVHRHSDCCGDNQESSKYPNVDYSYQACQKPKTQAQAPCRKPCRCSDSPAGGRCEAPYKGEYWCYVDPEACCEKKIRSVRHKNLYWSTEPCNGVEIPDLEDRLTEDGFLTCQKDQDCPPGTPLQKPGRCLQRRCVEEECMCSPRFCSEWVVENVCVKTNVSVIQSTVITPAGPQVCGISVGTLATHQHAILHSH